MGVWLFPIFLLVFMIGQIDLAKNHADNATAGRDAPRPAVDGGRFLVYRNAVDDYVTMHPSFTGTVPASGLSLPGVTLLPDNAGNMVVPTPNSGRIIVAWASLPPGSIAVISRDEIGEVDLSLGTSSGGAWSSPVGGTFGAFPSGITVPAGYAVSVVQHGT